MPRNYTIGQRAIIMIGIKAGKNCDEINTILKEEQKKQGIPKDKRKLLPASSYDMVKRQYIPNLNDESLWEHILAPKPIADLLQKP